MNKTRLQTINLISTKQIAFSCECNFSQYEIGFILKTHKGWVTTKVASTRNYFLYLVS